MKRPDVYYYVTGGTLRPDAPSYVERRADAELRDSLLGGEFCYVLTSRQMGKSSLMVRTVRKFREQGVNVAVLDLTAIGQNLTVDQWYEGLTERLGQQLNLDTELEDYWLANPRLSPVQRFFGSIREVALKYRAGRLVIFVDEIDSVRSLPFSTDEFFAAIRECYNRRAVDSELRRLTFCLLGVATPSDLIRDTRTTPFNIGERIELTDFTVEEAAALAPGLHEGRSAGQVKEVLCQVLHWTNGHPYLTQRLCKAVAEHPDVMSSRGVDALCQDLFLSDRARERDDNLVFVRERILRAEAERVSLLDLYLRVWQGRRVPDDPGNAMAAILKLAGIVRCESGKLVVRMRIYERVFDRKWALAHMPDAELRRQKEAFHSGILRTAAVATLLVVIIGGLARYAFEQAEQARINARAETFERQRAEEARQQLASILEQMEVHQAEELFRDDDSATALAYLAHALRNNPSNRVAAARLVSALTQRNFPLPMFDNARVELAPPAPARAGRKFEHRGESVFILNENNEPVTEQPLRHEGYVRDAQFSPDGQRAVTASLDNTARVWDATTGQPITPPLRHGGPVEAAQFSPDGLRIVTFSRADRAARVWDASTGEPLTEPMHLQIRGGGMDPRGGGIDFSADGQMLILRGPQGQRFGWDIRPGKALTQSLRQDQPATSVRFSPDGRRLVSVARDGSVRVWDARAGKLLFPPISHVRNVNMVAFNHDSSVLATASDDYLARLWNAETGEPLLAKPLIHSREVRAVQFSPDGTRVATASADNTAVIWNALTGEMVLPPLRHLRAVNDIAFSPDGELLLTIARDHRVRLWNARTAEPLGEPMEHEDTIYSASFSPDGTRVITAAADRSAGYARIWNARTGEPLTEPLTHNGAVLFAQFSPDGRWAVTASADRTARLWDAQTGQPVGAPLMHESPVAQARFFAGSSRILSAGFDKSISIWDIPSSQPLTENFIPSTGTRITPPAPPDSIFTTDLDSTNGIIATTGNDGFIHFWQPLNPPLPAPDWLATLAESISGERLNQRGLLESADSRLLGRLRDNLRRSPDNDFYTRWAQWFFADRFTRPIALGSETTVAEYVDKRLAENRLTSVQEAVRLSPTNALALARLGRALLDDNSPPPARTQVEAKFLTERALKLAPRLAEAWQRRVEVLALTGDNSRAQDAVERGLKLDPNHAGLWNAKGFTLEKGGQLASADAAYTKAIELAETAGQTAQRDAYFQNRTFLRQRLNTEPPGGATRD